MFQGQEAFGWANVQAQIFQTLLAMRDTGCLHRCPRWDDGARHEFGCWSPLNSFNILCWHPPSKVKEESSANTDDMWKKSDASTERSVALLNRGINRRGSNGAAKITGDRRLGQYPSGECTKDDGLFCDPRTWM